MATTLDQVIRERTTNESALTISIMRQVAARLDLHDPELFGDLYETVIFYTGSWPEDQGWGSSDTSAVLHSWVRNNPPHCLSCNEPLSLPAFLKNYGLCGGCIFEPQSNGG